MSIIQQLFLLCIQVTTKFLICLFQERKHKYSFLIIALRFPQSIFFTYLVSRFVYIHYYMGYDYSSFILCSKDILLNTHCKTSNCGHSHPEIFSLPNPAMCHTRVNKISIVLFKKIHFFQQNMHTSQYMLFSQYVYA